MLPTHEEINMFLPKTVRRARMPPLKCQGIKTKLVNFIASNITWNDEGRWVEPFLGSGSVLFNINPNKALVSDNNEHIINLYNGIKTNEITPNIVRERLQTDGKLLSAKGENYYYNVRDRFNATHDPIDFLFLNRSSYNGVIRFNRNGKFNVPFCRKSNRFSQAYITKIVNQIQWVHHLLNKRDWIFDTCDWRQTLSECNEHDFVYLDPPYSGKSTVYFDNWTKDDTLNLIEKCKNLKCGFAISMWSEDEFKKEQLFSENFSGYPVKKTPHFYYVGASNNHNITESLIVKPGFMAVCNPVDMNKIETFF